MMKTIKDILISSTEYLEKRRVPDSRFQAEETIASALNMKRLDLYMQYNKPLVDCEIDRCRFFLKRRGAREPLQYIEGFVKFTDLLLLVNQSVLIPRPETEILVHHIIDILKSMDLKGKVLWDVCAGSGCIGLALKKRFPDLEVFLSDISEEALSIAKENAKKNNLQVEFLQGDLLNPFNGQKCDFFVCNPPYVSVKDYENLEPEVKNFEPKGALVAESDGLSFYRRLANDLDRFLCPQGKVWFELGIDQDERVSKLFSNKPWINQTLIKDYAGINRFFLIQIS